MPEPFEVVRDGYDRIGQRYRDWSAAGAVRLHWVDRLLSELPAGSLVVDLGCGSGESATRMIAASHRAVGVDASAGQLALARLAAPTAMLVQADMIRFAVRAGTADAVVSFYALGHVPSHQHAPLIAAAASWLRPGGLLLTSAPVGAGDVIEADWLGVPMFFGGIGADATRRAVSDAGLRLITFDTVVEDEGDGHLVSFNWLIASKPAVA